MDGKGADAYREQNNVPYIIYHPDIQGGGKCKTVTSHVDLIPSILAMTGADKKQKPEVMKNLHGHDISPVLKTSERGGAFSLLTSHFSLLTSSLSLLTSHSFSTTQPSRRSIIRFP